MILSRSYSIYILPCLMFILAIFTSCDGLTGTEQNQPPIDWEDGPGIVEGDDSALPDSARPEWRKSARELALRHVVEVDSMEPTVPENLVDTYYNGLIHIATSSLESAKEATDEYAVRARPKFAHNQVLVFPEKDESTGWLDAWREGTVETGIPEIDELTETYDLTVAEFSEMESQSYAMVVLESEEFFNPIPAIADFNELESYFGIRSEVNSLAGDGSNIKNTFPSGYILYRFEYSWGDCPAGCINTHYWDFTVNAEGEAEFVGSGGDELPVEE